MLKNKSKLVFEKKLKNHAVPVDFLTKNSNTAFFPKMPVYVRKCFIVPQITIFKHEDMRTTPHNMTMGYLFISSNLTLT